jgi:hypothetical protein
MKAQHALQQKNKLSTIRIFGWTLQSEAAGRLLLIAFGSRDQSRTAGALQRSPVRFGVAVQQDFFELR